MKCSHEKADLKVGPYCPSCGILMEGWQNEDRVYAPAERQLDVRLDCTTAQG